MRVHAKKMTTFALMCMLVTCDSIINLRTMVELEVNIDGSTIETFRLLEGQDVPVACSQFCGRVGGGVACTKVIQSLDIFLVYPLQK